MAHLHRCIARVKTEVSALYAWWIHELKDLVETLLLRMAPQLVTRAVIRLSQSGCSVEISRGKERHAFLEYADLNSIHMDQALRGTRTTVVLAAADVFTHELTLPEVGRAELDKLVSLHLEHELPLPLDRICFYHEVFAHDRKARKIQARIHVAHRRRIEYLRKLTRSHGLRLVRICASTESGSIDSNFLQSQSEFDRLRLTRMDRRLAATAAGLAGAVTITLASQWIYERVQVAREMHRVSAAANVVRDLSLKLDDDAAPARALVKLSALSDATDVLVALTEAVPLDSWLYELEVKAPPLKAAQIKLSGVVPTATIFVDLLEKSPRFEKVHLVSASSAGLGSARDRLQVAASWTVEPRASGSRSR